MNFFEYHKLSVRETEICKMLMIGKCRKQIAAELGANYKSVTHSARRAFGKIGCRNDVDLLWIFLSYLGVVNNYVIAKDVAGVYLHNRVVILNAD